MSGHGAAHGAGHGLGHGLGQHAFGAHGVGHGSQQSLLSLQQQLVSAIAVAAKAIMEANSFFIIFSLLFGLLGLSSGLSSVPSDWPNKGFLVL